MPVKVEQPYQDRWQSDDGAVTLYLGDARDVVSSVGEVSAMITDPPYGIALSNHARGRERADRDWTIAGDDSQAVGQAILDWADGRRIPTAAFASPKKPWRGNWRQHLVWEKGEHVSGGGDPWLCWKPSWELLQVARNKPLNGSRDGAVLRFQADKDDYALHPSPKPVPLLVYIVEKMTNEGDLILDPFMGAGSCGAACIRLGRRFVGIEIDPVHYATAVARLSAEVDRFPLFAAQEQAEQKELWESP